MTVDDALVELLKATGELAKATTRLAEQVRAIEARLTALEEGVKRWQVAWPTSNAN